MATDSHKPKLYIRTATNKDIPNIVALAHKVYSPGMALTAQMVRGQISIFPEGQFVAIYDDKVVGYCATFIIKEKLAFTPHTWDEITGAGFASRHDINGDYLYGMEVTVDPDCRRLRIGQRFYNERKRLCKFLRLKGIVFGGRLPGYRAKSRTYKTPEAYLEAVKTGQVRDSVINFQLRNGYEILGILHGYQPDDAASKTHGVHMAWYNPEIDPQTPTRTAHTAGHLPDIVRVATVQLQMRLVESFDEFIDNCEYFVDVASDYRGDFVVFPEFFTLPLMALNPQEHAPHKSIAQLDDYTEALVERFSAMAVRYNINIIAGTHPCRRNGIMRNVCYVLLRDGSVHEQEKIHPTPNERYWWHIQGAHAVRPIQTDCGPIGIMICYDSEFPELARHLADQGAKIMFVPFCTDERQSYMRVRYCCQARAIENQCYVVMSGNVGNLPKVENMDIQYAQSCILTPCDFPFARDGIAADTTPNVETIAFADLRLESLREARNSGTVQNLKDRRFDLYTVNWKNK